MSRRGLLMIVAVLGGLVLAVVLFGAAAERWLLKLHGAG